MLRFLTRVPARPTPSLPSSGMRTKLPQELRDEYLSLAEKHQLSTHYNLKTENDTVEIVDFLTVEGVELYDYDHVVNYMEAIARKAGKELVWRSLRRMHDYNHHDTRGTYTRPVPIEVLRNVDKLSTRFGAENLIFAVTDIEVPNPDPFIRVNWIGSDSYIIFGMWDEPGYIMSHTQAASELKKITK